MFKPNGHYPRYNKYEGPPFISVPNNVVLADLQMAISNMWQYDASPALMKATECCPLVLDQEAPPPKIGLERIEKFVKATDTQTAEDFMEQVERNLRTACVKVDSEKINFLSGCLGAAKQKWLNGQLKRIKGDPTFAQVKELFLKNNRDDAREERYIDEWEKIQGPYSSETVADYNDRFVNTALNKDLDLLNESSNAWKLVGFDKYMSRTDSRLVKEFKRSFPERDDRKNMSPEKVFEHFVTASTNLKIFMPTNRDNRDNKRKRGDYNDLSALSPDELERYKKEGRCFNCGKVGHRSYQSPNKQQKLTAMKQKPAGKKKASKANTKKPKPGKGIRKGDNAPDWKKFNNISSKMDKVCAAVGGVGQLMDEKLDAFKTEFYQGQEDTLNALPARQGNGRASQKTAEKAKAAAASLKALKKLQTK